MTTTSHENFGTRLLRALEAENKSQADLARYCKVSRTAVSKWAHGTLPTVDLAIKISDCLNVSVRWLVRGGPISHRGIQLTDLERQLIGYLRLLESEQAHGVLAHAKGIAPPGKDPAELPSRLPEAVARKLSLAWPLPPAQKQGLRK